MKTKEYTDSVLGNVTLRKSTRARRLSLRVHPAKGVIVTVPFFVRYSEGIHFLESRRDWVLAVMEKLKASSETAQNADIPQDQEALQAFVEQLRIQAKADLPARLERLALRYGFSCNGVTVKHNHSNWGSCSARGHINLNLNLMRVPEILRDYVILHELCHLRHMNHSVEFHALLETLCMDNLRIAIQSGDDFARQLSSHEGPAHKLMERELKAYRLI